MSNLTERVDKIFAEWDKIESPGCALAVIQNGEIIYKRGYGSANLEHDIPIKPETIFDIGSTSKQFTALCILLLARQGKLNLDDPIQKHLPEMPLYEAPITVRHLVHHTSGIRDYLTLMALANKPFENDYQEPEVIALIARQQALNFPPGEEHLYCNSGYFLMAEIVERVAGQNMRDFAQQHIFGPLGMQHTHFHNNFKEIVRNRASGYSPIEEGGFEIDMGIFDLIGDGAVYTSVEDLYLWDQNYYDNKLDGGGQELIRQMEELGLLNSGEKLEYAFGLMISRYRGLPIVAHGGSWYGYRAQMLRFPEQRFSVICLSNLATMNPDLLCKKVADIYLEDLMEGESRNAETTTEVAAVDLPDEVLKQKIGIFHNPINGAVAIVSLNEEGLAIETMGYDFSLKALSSNHFKADGAPVTLNVFFEDDNTRLIADINDGYQKHTYERIKAVELTPEQMQAYSGGYYSAELDVTYTLKAVDHLLEVEPQSRFIKVLKPSKLDSFSAGPASVKFMRDENNQITGFSINAGRVKNIRFERKLERSIS
jgi:CubicO group peptidase (beta-lactamase class C family)